MKRTQLFTHTGWFGICPVYAADLESDCPSLTPREENWFYTALFFISHYSFMGLFCVADVIAPSWDPGFPIYVTGELLIPHRYEYEYDDDCDQE